MNFQTEARAGKTRHLAVKLPNLGARKIVVVHTHPYLAGAEVDGPDVEESMRESRNVLP